MADSMGTKEASERWGVSQSLISEWCREGLIPGATHDAKGSPWHIPKDAKCLNGAGEEKIFTLPELLPHSFGPEFLA